MYKISQQKFQQHVFLIDNMMPYHFCFLNNMIHYYVVCETSAKLVFRPVRERRF